MTIPKGKDYSFSITVIEKDSFLPQDLTNIDLVNSSFILTKLSDLCIVNTGTTTVEVLDALNGVIKVTLDSTLTESLLYSRGDAVDNYYLKPMYQGIITIKFTDTTPQRVSIIDSIYVAPTGITCV